MKIELKDFVAETLKQIIDGVILAQKYAKETGAIINPKETLEAPSGVIKGTDTGRNAQIVEFDVAITVSQDTEAKGGGKVFIGIAGIGSEIRSERQGELVQRIKFSVPMYLPNQEGDKGEPRSPNTISVGPNPLSGYRG